MPSTPPPTMLFHRRRTSDRASSTVSDDADSRQRVSSAPLPVPSSMRGMRRLEMRRGMEESHYLAQKARSSTLNAPVDMRLLDYVSDYDRNLMCPICRCPFVDPVVLTGCDHCFCRDCLSQTWTEYHPGGPRGNCPTCRRESRLAAKTAVSKILLNILDELVVKCPKHEDGCAAEMKRGEVQDHINLYCGYALVECPRQECEQPIRRKDANECLHYGVACIDCHDLMFIDNLENHWRRECPDRKVFCPHCEDSIYYRTLDLHTKETCPAITAPCAGAPYGCLFRSKRGELDSHSHACMFAILAPTFEAQQKRIDQQEETQKVLTKRLAVFEQGFEKLEALVCETGQPDLVEPNNPADPERIPLTLEARVRRQRREGSRDDLEYEAEDRMEHNISHSRQESTASILPEIEFPAPPSGRASRVGQQRVSYMSSRAHTPTPAFLDPQPHDLDGPFFQQPEDPYAQSQASHIQHLLSLHESLRNEVTRIAAALHDLDGRHSMLMLNENLRMKEDLAFLNAQVSGLGRQVGWLTSTAASRGPQMQAQQSQSSQSHDHMQSQNHTPTSEGDGDGELGGKSRQEAAMQNAVTALRGAARVVNLTRNTTPQNGQGYPRRIGSDEGRTKL